MAENGRIPAKARDPLQDLRGAARLALEATVAVTNLVEAMHCEIAGGPLLLGRPLAGPTRFFTWPVYESIRGVAWTVGTGVDLALARLAPLAAAWVGDGATGREREAAIAALNGVLGDHLAASGNPLAIPMRLRYRGEPLGLERSLLRQALPQAAGKVLVLVHGSCSNDGQWARRGHDHGAALERDLGFTPIYLHYNSGRHISQNGRELAALLEALVAAWPVPIAELVILAHSMGGLVARSACHFGEEAAHSWRDQLRALVCLGSPHHGAPLERVGHAIQWLVGVSRYSAPLAALGKLRSAGITDLRYGNVLDGHWEGRDRFACTGDGRSPLPLPAGVACYAVAAARAAAPGGRRLDDGLVPVDSALGRHARPELTLGFPEAHQWVAYGTDHLDLLSQPEVYAKIRSWLSAV
jgi:hypothetical protein